MLTNSNDVLLHQRLRASQEFAALGFVAELTERGGVLLARAGHVHGLWHFHDQAFHYTDSAYRAPVHRADTVDEAVMVTVGLLRSANRALAEFAKSLPVTKQLSAA